MFKYLKLFICVFFLFFVNYLHALIPAEIEQRLVKVQTLLEGQIFICSGTLLSPTTVVTSRHCVANKGATNFTAAENRNIHIFYKNGTRSINPVRVLIPPIESEVDLAILYFPEEIAPVRPIRIFPTFDVTYSSSAKTGVVLNSALDWSKRTWKEKTVNEVISITRNWFAQVMTPGDRAVFRPELQTNLAFGRGFFIYPITTKQGDSGSGIFIKQDRASPWMFLGVVALSENTTKLSRVLQTCRLRVPRTKCFQGYETVTLQQNTMGEYVLAPDQFIAPRARDAACAAGAGAAEPAPAAGKAAFECGTPPAMMDLRAVFGVSDSTPSTSPATTPPSSRAPSPKPAKVEPKVDSDAKGEIND